MLQNETDVPNNPAERVIAIFGNLTKTAAALDKPLSTVQGWRERGRIPPEHWKAIMEVAREQKRKRLKFEDFIPETSAS